MRQHVSLWIVAIILCVQVTAGLTQSAPVASELEYANLRNRLLTLERHVAQLSTMHDLAASERASRVDRLQTELTQVKARLAGHFAQADVALGESVDLVQKYGSAWVLHYLTHGHYTGRGKEEHKPIEAVDFASKNAEFAGKAALPFLGYSLMVILSYDAVCREAYHEFIPQMEAIVRDIEAKAGKPADFWEKTPPVIPNDLGWDAKRFWGFAQTCAGRVVAKYFWNAAPDEIRRATNLVSLVLCASLISNVTIDLDGDREAQTKRAFWRANAAPWLKADRTDGRNRFLVFHFFTHAWLAYLKLFNDARWDGRILAATEARDVTAGSVRNAFLFSDVVGFGYEAASTVAGTMHGFLETSSVEELPRPLMKVARFFHVKNVIIAESMRDLRDNHEGAEFGTALFLSNGSLELVDAAAHRQIVDGWRQSVKETGSNPAPASGGPEAGTSGRAAYGRVSVADLNCPEGKKRVQSGFFREVYRGTGAFEPAAHAAAELAAFNNLLGQDAMSYNLRQLYESILKTAPDPVNAYREAREQHAESILAQFDRSSRGQRAGIFKDLYSNEATRDSDKDLNHEADYVYTTRRGDIAGCYGPVVLVIRESQPRGLDLNQIADSYAYYGLAHLLKNSIRMRWKTLIGDYILDDDEYLIPSYVPAADIVGVLARSPQAHVVDTAVAAADKSFQIALKAPPVLRRYEKKMIAGYLVIDVFDGADRLIARLSESPAHTPVSGQSAPSGPLPDAIQAAWDAHMRAIGH